MGFMCCCPGSGQFGTTAPVCDFYWTCWGSITGYKDGPQTQGQTYLRRTCLQLVYVVADIPKGPHTCVLVTTVPQGLLPSCG